MNYACKIYLQCTCFRFDNRIVALKHCKTRYMYYIQSKIFLALLSSPKTWLVLLVFSSIFIFNFLLLSRIPNDVAIRQVCYFKVVIFQINFSVRSTYHYQRVDNHKPHDSVAVLTLGFPFRFVFC